MMDKGRNLQRDDEGTDSGLTWRSQHVGKMRLMLEYEWGKAIYCNFARLAIMYASSLEGGLINILWFE
ncbi:hypothetical protein Naga_100224g5 [Nannochloropsis gaditana]|uniref:Uncharacterized protein n=1 Tax=Nannochloropsis gaditana TaxID=72520 RepID=W7T5L3_9STRA|nr:hypothetical protein Naga_100224g5 [Nannochloropsis gaditana]